MHRNRSTAVCAIFCFLVLIYPGVLKAQVNEVECVGNTETFDKNVVSPGTRYLLSYTLDGKRGSVKVAGREFSVAVDRGTSWKGPWLKSITEKSYFSYLPEDGGTIKIQLDPKLWFSGNCR